MLPISVGGRTNAIKMIFLQQLLCLVQNILVFIAKAFFSYMISSWSDFNPQYRKICFLHSFPNVFYFQLELIIENVLSPQNHFTHKWSSHNFGKQCSSIILRIE